MFISKERYNNMDKLISELLELVNKQKFEIFVLKNKDRYIKCSLPNGLKDIAFSSEDELMEFMLLAQKKNIDISDIMIRKLDDGEYIYIFEKKASMHGYDPITPDGFSWHQRELIDRIPKWEEIRKKFEKYIL